MKLTRLWKGDVFGEYISVKSTLQIQVNEKVTHLGPKGGSRFHWASARGTCRSMWSQQACEGTSHQKERKLQQSHNPVRKNCPPQWGEGHRKCFASAFFPQNNNFKSHQSKWLFCREHHAPCNIVHVWVCGGSVMVWGGRSMEGQWTSTAVTALRYRIRSYPGAGGPGCVTTPGLVVCRYFL